MKLHTVFITYNRLELTKQAITSYLETVNVPYTYLVVDNNSSDGTKEWMLDWDHPYVSLTRNRYPGFACNFGWAEAGDADFLHRADNDFAFLPGWCDEVKRRFRDPGLGQLGLRTDEEEFHNLHNVGGNCIIRRELWDEGMRWDERPWPEIKTPGYTEDSFFSPQVKKRGWEWDRVERPCIQPIAYEDPADPYYVKSWADRGITPAA